ncbi:protein VARIATION IN COMPOUND TRIGGERED ROOT growth response isoform X2 [Brassica rapa]|uniref:protein VARIATION IN COMPOUND TRIGGERED ROOT growth response isoform X2 n=1 Tax=Brassica campestris TaxID=3711 RepID=UPI00142DCEDA|nr:protein VARIATION IN COMPOUND TRIGGERED ROOT growth response isoform X2 [Brassica rapa]
MALSLASSPSSSRTWLYDVFPSFSGVDVRVTFLSHLLKEFDKKLITAFKDNEIERSRSLDPELKQAIKDSRIAVVIFSQNYASSSWCLNELLEIVKCGQMVIPVFYRLDPSHVRKQTGDFGKIFEETCKNQTEEVIIIQWRRALTDVANTLGYHSVNWGNEAAMIEEIANDVLDKLLLTSSKDSENFVGIEDHVAKLSVLLQLDAEEVRMVGLWGSSGIGKTTIARVLFQRLSQHFRGSIFIDRAFVSKTMEIFKEANPDDYNMKLHLQRNFLSEILGKGDIKINHLSAVGERLKNQKVLIFIDDFDDQVVLEALVGQTQWFGSGSRIVVVTNDKQYLRAHGINHIYEVYLPTEELAVEMLCRSAFRKKAAPEGFEELVAKVTGLAGSLPLGLNVLGSSLRGRDKEYWMDLLPRLQNGLDGKIEKTLRVSYDGLTSEEDKALFRHIACLFQWEKVTYLKLLLADSGLSVTVGLENLADKSLIHVREDYVKMHRLLEEMGRGIVRLEEPEKREFLVDAQDICDVLSQDTGTHKILGIKLNIDEIDELNVHENAFKGMRNLRFLEIHSKKRYEIGNEEVTIHLPENFDYLPPKLKILDWFGYPMRCLPSKFRPEKLVKLKMVNSKLEKLWEGIVSLTCLKEMDMWGSTNLIEMPDLSKATNLETLKLRKCYSLVKLPSSIPHPNKLKKLDLRNCRNVETIPTGISLKSLKDLNTKGCSRMRTFPQISSTIEDVDIDATFIEEIRSNLSLCFENLHTFTMHSPKKLWERVQVLSPSLWHLDLSDNPGLVELPSSFKNLHNLSRLKIRNCVNLETLPTGINLGSLSRVDLSGCSRLRTFPQISTNIQELDLSETGIEEVPCWIEKFSRLNSLQMKGCNNLEYVNLNISDCKSLTGASWNNHPRESALSYYHSFDIGIDFTKCLNLVQEALFQKKTYFGCQLKLSGEEVPSYFTHRTTGTSSSLTIPLLHSSLTQPFLRFRACIVFDSDKESYRSCAFRFKGSFRNCSDSYNQAQDFCAVTEDYKIFSFEEDSCLFVLDYQMTQIPLEMNFDGLDLKIHIVDCNHAKIKGWGIRILEEDCSSADNRLSYPNILPHVFEADECNMRLVNVEANDAVTERSGFRE